MAEWNDQLASLGEFLRAQRQMANLSLRQLAEMAQISNPYLSQLERGLHEPSVRVLRSLARALDVSAETLLEQAGLRDDDDAEPDAQATERSIRADPRLSAEQKKTLLSVYRNFIAANDDD